MKKKSRKLKKLDDSVIQLNNDFRILSANQVSEEKINTLNTTIKMSKDEIKHVDNETKINKSNIHALNEKLEQRNDIIDKDIKQSKDDLKNINEESKQNKSEIQSVSKKLDESNDKVISLSNSLFNLQSTVETLQKQANSNLPLQKSEDLENNQIPPPSGQEVHSTVTQLQISR